jgi:carbamoyl-phosphate synthase large subunit
LGSPRASTVIVVWVGYRAGPWVLRALRTAGHRAVGVHTEPHGGRSTACLRPLRCPSPAADPEGFLAALDHLCRACAADAVLPLSENAVEILAGTGGRVGGAVVVGPDAARYRALCDKEELGRTLAAAGLEGPVGVSVGPAGPSGPWPALPSVVKLRESAMGGSAIEVEVASDAETRDAAVRSILTAGHEAVVQERVTGVHWTVHAVRGGDGRFAAVLGGIVRTFPRAAGIPSVIRVVAREGPAVDVTRRLLEHVDYRGLANVQLFECEGRFLVHDVNTRPPAPVALSIAAGLNLPALAVAAVLDRPWAPPTAPLSPFTYVSRFDELRGWLEDVRGDGALAFVRRRVPRGGGRLVDPPLRDPLWLERVPRALVKRTRRRLPSRVR